jgi:hypothetical protein
MPTQRLNDDFKKYVLGDVLDLATEWIGIHLDPEDVFSETKLEKWAEANGYTKIEKEV